MSQHRDCKGVIRADAAAATAEVRAAATTAPHAVSIPGDREDTPPLTVDAAAGTPGWLDEAET